MYSIKPEFLNKTFHFKRKGIEITFDTSIQYTQYQLYNMYKLEQYSNYIQFTEQVFSAQIEKQSTLDLEYVQLPKQDPIITGSLNTLKSDEPVIKGDVNPINITPKPKKSRTTGKPKKKAKVETAVCDTCNNEPCECDVPKVD